MKILLSAYACHPTSGSESRLGWQWAKQLASRGHDVWVITRGVMQQDIEHHLTTESQPGNLNFIYHECRALLPWLKLFKARFRYIYYYFWQWGAYQAAMQAHVQNGFDLVHHVTWVQYRAPSFMGRLGIPFIFGPVGGGEASPWNLRSVIGLRQWGVDLMRDGWSLLASIDPLVRRTYHEAIRIPVTSVDTLNKLPPWARAKARLQLAIAYEPSAELQLRRADLQNIGGVKLLYVGRFLGLKGMALGLAAFAAVASRFPDASLTLVGEGPVGPAWHRLADRLGIAGRVHWIDWLPHAEVEALYANHDVLLFPSLHDSGGLVLLEAMSRGLPVVCLNLGGPGMLVDETCGIRVEVAGRTRCEVEKALAAALERILAAPEFLASLRQGAQTRAGQFNWDHLINGVYDGLVPAWRHAEGDFNGGAAAVNEGAA
ncbi:MAG: glycosyltransferase family 4 protein [Gallionellaceae bacterium]|nr:glycosyltransferase family 4 protein [Gallionellaceae bacterium]